MLSHHVPCTQKIMVFSDAVFGETKFNAIMLLIAVNNFNISWLQLSLIQRLLEEILESVMIEGVRSRVKN